MSSTSSRLMAASNNDKDIAARGSLNIDQDEQGSKFVMSMPPKTAEQVRATTLWMRRYEFDELFYKFWRIDDGWLSRDETKRALEFFNDPLAIAVRRAVATRLYPHLPKLAI